MVLFASVLGHIVKMLQKVQDAATVARERAASTAEASRAAASAAAVAATGAAYSTVGRAKDAYEKGELGEALSGVYKDRVDVRGLRDAGYGLAGDALKERKKQAQIALLEMSAPARQRALLGIRDLLKTQVIADPDMWSCASRRIQEGIDVFWDDLTVYIETIESSTKDSIRDAANLDLKQLEDFGEPPCCCSPNWWRAKILYHFAPFDRSMFGQCKDPLFWIFTVLACTTAYGVRVAFFSIILILMLAGCPADEYQLVQYILAFKGTQFISSGVCMAIFAAVKYYMCVLPGGRHTCDKNGPGVTTDVVSSAVDYFGCCILCWVVFILLRTSKRSAGLKDLAEDPEAAEKAKCCNWHQDRGGRLTGLLGYDLFCFTASCGLCYFLSSNTANAQDVDLKEAVHTWEFRTAIFWARVFYSMLAFPFILFVIPGVNSILTHTTATGYNGQGICVPYMLHPMPVAQE